MSQKKYSKMKNNLLPHLSSDNASKLHGEFVSNFWPIIGTSNQATIRWFFETFDALEEAGLLKREVKLHCNKCSDSIDTYQKNARASLEDRFAVWSDLTNVATHNLYPDIVRLYFSIKAAIDKNEVKDDSKKISSALRAKVFTAQVLAQITVGLYDSLAEKYQSQTVFNIKKDFNSARFTSVLHHLTALTKYFAQTKGVVDLNEDNNCKLGVKVILSRFETKDFINEAAGQAIRQNPKIYDSLSDQDKEIIDNGTKEKDTAQGESEAEE